MTAPATIFGICMQAFQRHAVSFEVIPTGDGWIVQVKDEEGVMAEWQTTASDEHPVHDSLDDVEHAVWAFCETEGWLTREQAAEIADIEHPPSEAASLMRRAGEMP